MGLDGIAGRQLLGRLSAGMRDGKDRAAMNDNRPVEVTRRHREAEAAALGRNKAHATSGDATRMLMRKDTPADGRRTQVRIAGPEQSSIGTEY
jgi:hypothetical protein